MLLFWIKCNRGPILNVLAHRIWPNVYLAHKSYGPQGNMAHFGPLLRKSGRATGQAAVPNPGMICGD